MTNLQIDRYQRALESLAFIELTTEGKFYIDLLITTRYNSPDHLDATLDQTEAFLRVGGAGLHE